MQQNSRARHLYKNMRVIMTNAQYAPMYSDKTSGYADNNAGIHSTTPVGTMRQTLREIARIAGAEPGPSRSSSTLTML
jgi:hypothetical protein